MIPIDFSIEYSFVKLPFYIAVKGKEYNIFINLIFLKNLKMQKK